MTRLRRTFASLSNRNYRLFFIGQGVSLSGNWMQRVGQAWLILELSGSGTLVGLTAAMQHLPTMLLGAWGGLQADRFDKRQIILVTQAVSCVLAVALGVLTAAEVVESWMVLAMALLLGLVDIVDRPARKAIVYEMVGPSHLTNAVTLNIVVLNIGRIIGPAAAGLLIAHVGIAFSFLANGLTYVAGIVVLLLMRPEEIERPAPVSARPGLLKEGTAYIRQTPELFAMLLLLATMTMFAYSWEVTLALLARDTFQGGAEAFGLMLSAMGAGAIAGGLVVAGHETATARRLLLSAAAFGSLLALVALAPGLEVALVLLVPLGASSVTFRSLTGARVLMLSEPQMRGRVTGLLGVASVGTKTIGSPIVGWIGEHVGARAAILVGAAATGVAIVVARGYLRRNHRHELVSREQCTRDDPRSTPVAGIHHDEQTTGFTP